MSLSVVVKPNADFTSGNITRALLNQAAKPTVAVAGSIGTEEIEALSITEGKIADKTLTGNKLADTTIGVGKLANLGRGNVLVGRAKDEEDNKDGGDTVLLKLPENGFLVGDGNDVKAMVFDNSSSGAINMSQYTDSSTGDTSFKYELRSDGVKSAHVSPRAINLSKLSPNGGTASTDKTHSALVTFDGGELADKQNYGKATLTQAGSSGTVLRSNGKENALTFGSVMSFASMSANVLDATNQTGTKYIIAHNFTEEDGTTAVLPSLVRAVLVCVSEDATNASLTGDNQFKVGDEVGFESILSDSDSSDYGTTVGADATNVWAYIDPSKLPHVISKAIGTGDEPAMVGLTKNKWKIKIYAAY